MAPNPIYPTFTMMSVVCMVSLATLSLCLIPGSCHHMVDATVLSSREDIQYDACYLTMRYHVDGNDYQTEKRMSCAPNSEGKIVRGCYRHWEPESFKPNGNDYLAFPLVFFLPIAAAFFLVLIPVFGYLSVRDSR